MGTAKVEVGKVRRSWELPGMSEEEVAFDRRFVARHGVALVAMGEAQQSYQRDVSPGMLHGSGEPFVFFYFAQPSRLCARLRSTDVQPGRSLLCIGTFFLVVVQQAFHRYAKILRYFKECRAAWHVAWIVRHAPHRVDRNVSST
ncbi:MAG TPA: hypothetical protein VKX46_21600 [Ktedonobacteraceae bacterium]|nr:hypothetical protein [Ktedonobacteraceae bacterium]